MARAPSAKNKIVNIGTSLILVVFIILAMVTFAALSAVAASSDYNASANTAGRTRASYEALVQAEERLGHIQVVLEDAYAAAPGQYPANSRAGLEALGGLTLTEEGGVLLCAYSIPISETQALYAELAIQAPASPKAPLYTRTAWQERPTQIWEADTSVTLIQ